MKPFPSPRSSSLTGLLMGMLLGGSACGLVAADGGGHRFAIGEHDFLLDGQPLQIRCGELHAARVPREYWAHRLRLLKAMGLNTVCAYLFWNVHEPRPGEFDWAGQADAAEFCRVAQAEGLWVILRPGPYACAEWEMGGFPWWLLKHEDIQLRTRDPRYLEAARRYLGDPQLAVYEVAYLLGYSEPSAFHRAFRRWTGQTPREYRSELGPSVRAST